MKTLNRTTRNQTDSREGATLVEFVVVAPLLFTCLFASIEFAHLTTLRNTANNAAYEAARVAVVPGATKSEAETEARRILAIVGIRKYALAVSDVDADSETITVSIEIPYADNAILMPWFTGNVTIHSKSTLRTERYGGIPTP